MNGRSNLCNLNPILTAAERGGYAVGSFSPRYNAMIAPVLGAAQALRSSLIVRISQKELIRHQIARRRSPASFTASSMQGITVPVVLHLDHTRDFDVI